MSSVSEKIGAWLGLRGRKMEDGLNRPVGGSRYNWGFLILVAGLVAGVLELIRVLVRFFG